jgi:uncharacterized membrane protein YccF (DUF307 family)
MGNASNTTVVVNGQQTGCLTQIIYFIFIGWWWGAIWISVAWGAMVTVIGLPLAIWMINRAGQAIALRGTRQQTTISNVGGVMTVTHGQAQHNFIVRAIWFLLIGWWFSAIWMATAYAFAVSVFLMPIGFWMFDRTPGILTLQR